jgi:hypothetical protein
MNDELEGISDVACCMIMQLCMKTLRSHPSSPDILGEVWKLQTQELLRTSHDVYI